MAPVIAALEGRCDVLEIDIGANKSLAHCMGKIESSLAYNRPDIVLLLGDRYEIGIAAMAATIARIPIAHIHGGEASFGSFDNQIRDAVTKLSHIHLVSSQHAFARVVALGESPKRIHVVGAPGLDNIVPIMAEASSVATGFDPRKSFGVTYHPATLGDDKGAAAMVEALKQFPDYTVMWTGINNDPGARELYQPLLEAFGGQTVMSADGYLRTVRDCAAVIGNSSSGIIEAPSLGVPTVNIGPRQDGRLKGPSVIDCGETADEIVGAIKAAISYDLVADVDCEHPYDNPYGGPGASAKIADILATIDLDGILVKRWS